MPPGPTASVASSLRAGARRLSRVASIAADAVRPPAGGVTILIYHRVGARTPTSVDLPTAAFEAQIAHLATACRVVPLTEAAALLADPADGDEVDGDRPVVVVTFDDGTADFVDEALPILARYGVPVTYYVTTDFIERAVPFPDGGVPMTWSAVTEAVASGLVDIGSHTHTHALFDRIPRERVVEELDRSIDLIGANTGRAPEHFAYPKALPGSPEAEIEVRERFTTATIARTRANPVGADLHRLTRSPLQRSDTEEVFRRKVAGGMGLENDVRDLVNRWRYRGATS